jgi:hypothetical protein
MKMMLKHECAWARRVKGTLHAGGRGVLVCKGVPAR